MTRLEPYVSVVIPTRDRPWYARRAVRSVLAQQGVRVQVVLVDDGSETPLADTIGLDDPRVLIVRHCSSLGVAAARNRGIDVADGPWVAFLDDDDMWAPDKLQRQLEAATAAGAQWCITAALHLNVSSNPTSLHECPAEAAAVQRGLCSHNSVPGGGSGVLVSQRALALVGGFAESLSMCADWEMWHRLAHALPCAIVADPLVGYTIHESSMTSQFADHASEMTRMDSLVSTYCDRSPKERRLVYATWAATNLANHDRSRSARLLVGVAASRRSPRLAFLAARILLVPTTFSVRRFVGLPLLPVPSSAPAWVTRVEIGPEMNNPSRGEGAPPRPRARNRLRSPGPTLTQPRADSPVQTPSGVL